MILRFIQLSVLLTVFLSAHTQNCPSYYVKPEFPGDAEKIQALLELVLPHSHIRLPFAGISYGNLYGVLRIDACTVDSAGLKKMIPYPLAYIEKVPVARPAYTPDDLGVELGSPNQWYLYKLHAQEAWDYSKGSADVTVAVVDNAFGTDHPDLVQKIRINPAEIPGDGIDNDNNGFTDDYAGWNATADNGDPAPQAGNTTHGTHVAGIAAAQTDNGTGMASLSFLTRWLPVKAGDADDNITHGYEGIAFAAARGADIINCSWGSFDSSITAKTVIDFALSGQCIIVASAGNFADEVPVYPATYQGVISVAAGTPSDAKLGSSSYGTRINICAPGSGIWSTTYTDGNPDYGFLSGTSAASPLVASLLALMKGYAPAGNDALIIQCLYNTAENIDSLPANSAYAGRLGHGRADAGRAMACLQETLQLSIGTQTDGPAPLLYPNPSPGPFRLQGTESLRQWTMTDMQGRTILSGSAAQGYADALPGGLYVLSVEWASGRQSVFKFVKE